MRHFFTILAHEIRVLLVNPSTYLAAVLFLLLMGFIFTGLLENYSGAPQDESLAAVFFQLFWIPVFFMVPLLTMKSIAEERRLGTLETLLTTPVTTTEVVLGKFGAAYALYLLLWSATAGFFFILSRFAQNTLFIDAVPLFGGYAFIALSGLLFIAIGILASSFSRNQAIAGLLGFVLLFALVIGTRFLADVDALQLDVMAPLLAAVNYAQVFTHLDDFTRGVVDTRQVIFYLSGTTLTLLLGILGIEARQVHS
jgi:ABC-2 type transport system permease protein